MCQTQALRSEIVEEARSWIRTPYRLGSCVKQAGVDCGLLPYAVYRKFGLLPEISEQFHSDWFQHTTKERYLLLIERYARRMVNRDVASPLPGDLALAKVGASAVFNHAGIVTAWPRLVHAGTDMVEEVNAISDVMWMGRQIMIFDFTTKAVAA